VSDPGFSPANFAPGDSTRVAHALAVRLPMSSAPVLVHRPSSMHLSPAALDAAIRLLETGTETVRAAVEK
jgi:hypothetical protein